MIAATMFGVTTACVNKARETLEQAGYEVLVFHAVGSGGRAMEELVRAGFVVGVLDMTTTELADELAGGVLSAGPRRLEAAGETGVPQVRSLGALDMVNFGARDSVPAKYSERRFYQHNPLVTLMRTTRAENAELGASSRKAQSREGRNRADDSREGRLSHRRFGPALLRQGGGRGVVRRAAGQCRVQCRRGGDGHRHQQPGIRRRGREPPSQTLAGRAAGFRSRMSKRARAKTHGAPYINLAPDLGGGVDARKGRSSRRYDGQSGNPGPFGSPALIKFSQKAEVSSAISRSSRVINHGKASRLPKT